MNPVELKNATRIRKASLPDQPNLTIEDRSVGGQNQMVTLWTPSDQERAEIAAGGFVRLTIEGSEFPAVEVTTQAARKSDRV